MITNWKLRRKLRAEMNRLADLLTMIARVGNREMFDATSEAWQSTYLQYQAAGGK